MVTLVSSPVLSGHGGEPKDHGRGSRRLIERALPASGEGVTATIRRGLELVAAGRACEDLKALRGRVRLSLDLERLREDR